MTNPEFSRLWRLPDRTPVANIDTAIGLVESERAEVLDLQREIMAAAPPPDVRATYFTKRDSQAVRSDLLFLVHGVTADVGVTNSRLAARVGKPGLAALDRLVARLRAKREAEASRPVLTWPRAFRLKAGKQHAVGERDLKPGEVIELNERQATAFADKFEPVLTAQTQEETHHGTPARLAEPEPDGGRQVRSADR